LKPCGCCASAPKRDAPSYALLETGILDEHLDEWEKELYKFRVV